MSVVGLLMAAEAAAQNRAVRRTAHRHRYLSARPLVVTAYNLSGEAAAPLGFCYGTDPKRPRFVVAHEPRNRESRFAAINTFCADFAEFVAPYLELTPITSGRSRRTIEVAQDAPQIIVPNSATRAYLGTRLGRSLRYLGWGNTHDVPDETKWAAAHLSWLADHAALPGQSVFQCATELLTRHFATGQSDLENENLASLLAWIENPAGTGRASIDAAEDAAFGPVPDPKWEAELEPLVHAWSQPATAASKRAVEKKIAAHIESALRPAYHAVHRAIGILRKVGPASHVADRWEDDLKAWSGHARRAAQGIPRFTPRHGALHAARMLETWSRALERLEYQETLDDPLILAELDAEGRCLVGSVVAANGDHMEVRPGNKNRTRVPLLTVQLEANTHLVERETVCWTAEPKVTGEIRRLDERSAVVALVKGSNHGQRMPKVGDTVVFADLTHFDGSSPAQPDGVPWTHREPDEARSRSGGDDGSSDRTAAELAAAPIVGLVSARDVPGVVS